MFRSLFLLFLVRIQTQMKEQQGEMSRGKKNWQKLRNIILSKNLSHKQKGNKFELFKRETKVQQNILYTTYHFEHWELIQAAPLPLYKQLLHFKSEIDATGKWVWEAEEIAAYFLIKQGHEYLEQVYKMSQEGKRKPRVLQLGAGCSGLASIAYARLYEEKYKEQPEVRLTDGQHQHIQFLQRNIKLNKLSHGEAECLQWGEQKVLMNLTASKQARLQYDLVFVCDCLYFTDFHNQLLLTIDSYLSEHGTVLLVNPSRGQSMMQFLSLATYQGRFCYEFVNFEDQLYQNELKRLQNTDKFNPQKDIPYFIELKRKTKSVQE